MKDEKKRSLDRLLRVDSILGKNGILPISKATWFAGVRSGRYPKPVKLGPNISAWRLSDINELTRNGFNEEVK